MKKETKIQVKQDPENEVATEIMAQAIIDISRGVKLLLNGRLKREAVVILIKEKSGISKRNIEIVLNNLVELEELWTKKVPR